MKSCRPLTVAALLLMPLLSSAEAVKTELSGNTQTAQWENFGGAQLTGAVPPTTGAKSFSFTQTVDEATVYDDSFIYTGMGSGTFAVTNAKPQKNLATVVLAIQHKGFPLDSVELNYNDGNQQLAPTAEKSEGEITTYQWDLSQLRGKFIDYTLVIKTNMHTAIYAVTVTDSDTYTPIPTPGQ